VDLLLDLLVLAQNTPFGPVPTPEPTIGPGGGQDEVSRETLYLIAAAVLLGVVALGYFIARDARSSLPADEREELERERDGSPIPDLEADQREKRARDKKQRAKAKAARRARRANR